ncbi:MAG: hypothetical protein K1X55_13160 [Chitinophagales bacterium]|nr:hypothetical protein [Chitinophagales bacterium]
MKTRFHLLLVLLMNIPFVGFAQQAPNPNNNFLFSPIDLLLKSSKTIAPPQIRNLSINGNNYNTQDGNIVINQQVYNTITTPAFGYNQKSTINNLDNILIEIPKNINTSKEEVAWIEEQTIQFKITKNN